MGWEDEVLNYAARFAGPQTAWGRGEKAFSDAIGGSAEGMQVPDFGSALYNAPTAGELWNRYSNYMRNDLPWVNATLGGNTNPPQEGPEPMQVPPPEIRNKPPVLPPPEIRYKPGLDPRSKGLKAEGFSEFAPGQFYRDDSKVQGPRETRSDFGKEYQVPLRGGTSSMMQVSGSNPMAENLAEEEQARSLKSATMNQAIQQAQVSPQERARLSAKPDVRLSAWQTGMAIEAQAMAEEDAAEQRLRAEWAAKSPNTQPTPAAIQEARQRASAKYQSMRELAKAGITQDRPSMGESFAAQNTNPQ